MDSDLNDSSICIKKCHGYGKMYDQWEVEVVNQKKITLVRLYTRYQRITLKLNVRDHWYTEWKKTQIPGKYIRKTLHRRVRKKGKNWPYK